LSTNPIIDDKEMPRWRVNSPRPVPKADTCLVFVDGKGEVYAPQQPITLGQAVWGNLRRFYEVDLAEHSAELALQLPCAEKGFYFDAALHFRWRVHGPDVIVRDRRTDVVPVYTDYLDSFLSDFSEHYGLEERDRAQRELQQKLNDPMITTEGITIVRCGIKLTLGDAAETHLRRRTETTFALEAGQQDFRVQTQVGDHRGEHQKRQERLETELEDLRHERQRVQQMHENAMAQVELKAKFERMTMYGQALKEGNSSALLFLLDQNKGDIGPVLKLVLAERSNNLQNSRELAINLVDRGLLNGADVDPAAQRALQNLIDGLDPTGIDRALGSPGRQDPELPAAASGDGGGSPHLDGEDDDDDDDD